MTSIEPETFGNVMKGLEFHKFYFENQIQKNQTASKSMMMKPTNVTLMGSDAAVISYTRLEQVHEEATGAFRTSETAESLVWHRKDGKWQLVHFHKSNTGSSTSVVSTTDKK